MDALDAIEPALGLVMAALGAVFIWRQSHARRRARARPALEAAVVSVERSKAGGRMYSWFVDTRFDVPGHGILRHRKGFGEEGEAILFARLHREGSVHRVVPDEVEEGQAFLVEDLEGGGEWILTGAWLLVIGLALWGAWTFAVEYWAP